MVVAALLQAAAAASNQTHSPIGDSIGGPVGIIIGGIVIGALYALYCCYSVAQVVVVSAGAGRAEERRALVDELGDTADRIRDRVATISGYIADGAKAFLYSEYRIMAVFMVLMGALIFVLIGVSDGVWGDGHSKWIDGAFSALAFIIGAATSIASGYIGMRIAVYTNSRTAVCAWVNYESAFATAYKGGIVMGFGLTSLGLLALFLTIIIFRAYYSVASDASEMEKVAAMQALMAAVAPFGLGGSSIALFGRVGGGIFTKAADVGADLVGKVQQGIPEDDERNPGVIADNVGDNVGDIAGMGSDLFGSFGEASCAALVVSTTSVGLCLNFPALLYPLCLMASGVVVCLITSMVALYIKPPTAENEIEPCLKQQLLISTILMSAVLAPLTYAVLPSSFYMDIIYLPTPAREVTWWHAYLSTMFGLWSGLIIGYVTEYFTSNRNAPTRKVAEACKTGAATNIIHGLALGYESAIVPCACIALSVYGSFLLAGCYGVALAALGILSTMAVALAIDGYGPISDNAGGIAEMAHMPDDVRRRTDALDAAGNTTAAIGKGFAIGSAAFVSVALFGAFETQVRKATLGAMGEYSVTVNILKPETFFGLIIGCMLPYWFSAMTMKSVGAAAMQMVREIQRQFQNPGLMDRTVIPDYNQCVHIATQASLREMIPPGILVMGTPLLVGIFLGPDALAGLLPGAMASGVTMATASANTGGAWDNAKKYIEAGNIEGCGKGSAVHHSAVIGDTVGDPLKDTSGPALNILVKLMAILSVVFAPIFAKANGLIFTRLICNKIGVSYQGGLGGSVCGAIWAP